MAKKPEPKPSKNLGLKPKDVKRHNGMNADRDEPASKKHGPIESLKGTLAGLKDFRNGR